MGIEYCDYSEPHDFASPDQRAEPSKMFYVLRGLARLDTASADPDPMIRAVAASALDRIMGMTWLRIMDKINKSGRNLQDTTPDELNAIFVGLLEADDDLLAVVGEVLEREAAALAEVRS